MPQQEEAIGVTSSPGMRRSAFTAAGKAPKAF